MESVPFLPSGRPQQPRRRNEIDHRLFFICLYTLKFATQFVNGLLELPVLRLVEYAICRYVGPTSPGHTDEEACKSPMVQDELAFIMGFKWAFDALPGLLTAIAYGALADQRGRRLVIALAIIGQALSLSVVLAVCLSDAHTNPRALWPSSLLLLIGGGIRMEINMYFTTLADVVPSSERTQALFFLHAVTHFGRLVGPLVGAALLELRIWAPFALALATYLFKLMLLSIVPETSTLSPLKPHTDVPNPDPSTPEDAGDRYSSEEHSDLLRPTPTEIGKSLVWPRLAVLGRFLRHRGLLIIFACFLAKRIGFTSESLTFQYASEKFAKKLSETVWLRVTNTIGAIAMLTLILPFVTKVLALQTPQKDRYVISICLSILVFAFFVIWGNISFVMLCIGMTIAGLGEGLEPALQALGSYIVRSQNFAAFFSFVSILDGLAELIGGPLMARFYSIRGEDRLSLGYCFLLSSAIFGCLLVSSFFIENEQLA